MNAQQAMERNEALLRSWTYNFETRDGNSRTIVFEGGVTGITYHRYFDYAKYITEGTQLLVKPDPTNQFDINATGIWFNKGDGNFEQIGWIPKALNRVAARAWKAGHKLEAVVFQHKPNHGDNNQKLIISVTLKKSDSKQALHPPPSSKQTKLSEQKALTAWESPFIAVQTNPLLKGNIMAKSVNAVIEQNISLGTSAAFLEAGRIANSQLSQMASKKLPIMVRAYADTALGRLLLANVALMARDHFRPNDERLAKLVNAMTVSAYQEVLQNFDIEAMIEDLISNKTIVKALKSFDVDPA